MSSLELDSFCLQSAVWSAISKKACAWTLHLKSPNHLQSSHHFRHSAVGIKCKPLLLTFNGSVLATPTRQGASLSLYPQWLFAKLHWIRHQIKLTLSLQFVTWEAGCYWKGFGKRDGTTRRHPPSPVHQQGTVTSEFARKPSCLLWPGCQQRSKAWTNKLRSIKLLKLLWLILTVDIEIEFLGRMSLQHCSPFC